MKPENVAVLLVDDRSENLTALEAVLDNQGLELVKAQSGNDALRLSLKQDFALVLLDVQMPGMSGFETAELMRANPKTRHLPIIFVTAGMNDVKLQFKGYELGAVDYLIKPFEPHILQSKVKVFCELYRYRSKLELAHQDQLINTMSEGYAHCKMLYKGSQPKDFVFIQVNAAFEPLTGLKNVEGRRVGEIIPDIQESNPDMFEAYGRVATTGNPEILEIYVEPLNRWFSISVYSTEKEHFIAVFQNISERKQAEQAIRENEIKYRQLFEASSDGIYIQDANGIFIDCNENGALLFGISKVELIGRSPADFSPERQPDGRLSAEVVGEKFAAALNGISQRFEFKTLRADGVLFDAVVLLNRIEMRGTFCIHVVAHDITELKRVEEVTRQAANHTKILLNSVAEGIYGVDMHGNCTFINSAGLRSLGYQKDTELISKYMHDMIHHTRTDGSNYPAKECRLYHSLISHENIHVDDELFWRKDGSSFPVDYWSCPTWKNDEVGGAVITFIDITERKLAEQALRESEERWQFAIDGAGDGVWDWNLETGRIVFSKRYLEMLGYAGNVNWNCLDDWKNHVAPEEMQQAMVMLEAYLDGKFPTYSTEYRMQRADGSWAWILTRGKVVSRAADGRPLRLIGTHTDITERKQNEERITALNKELDDFTYIVAHDLKEPLRGINNYASFLKEDYASQLGEQGQKFIDGIHRLTNRLTSLIDSLLAYSRLGNTEFAHTPIDVDAIVDEVAEDLSRLWTREGIELRRNDQLGIITGDVVRIGEVFQNLISNAAKYNDKPSKWIEVGCDRSSAPPVFYVRDNGIGIAPHHHENVFRIFKRLNEKNKYGEGTGAGLTIVKKIIERHGGRIWLESTPGEGTTFYFTLSGEA